VLLRQQHGVFGESNVVADSNAHVAPGRAEMGNSCARAERIGFKKCDSAWDINVKEVDFSVFGYNSTFRIKN
jgi:hypothetical protein